jgi:hypothetical protein
LAVVAAAALDAGDLMGGRAHGGVTLRAPSAGSSTSGTATADHTRGRAWCERVRRVPLTE